MEQLGQGLLSLEQDIRGIEYSLIGQQYLGSERDLKAWWKQLESSLQDQVMRMLIIARMATLTEMDAPSAFL